MKNIGKLLLGLVLIWLFIWKLAPAFLHFAGGSKMIQFIEKEDIDSGGLFYTESPEVGRVEFFMKKNKEMKRQKE